MVDKFRTARGEHPKATPRSAGYKGNSRAMRCLCPYIPCVEGRVRIRYAFTLTELLLASVIVGIIAVLVVPAIVTKYQQRGLDQAYERETKTIESAVKGLAVNENKSSFFDTMMYQAEEPENYENSAEVFLKKYLRVSKICGDNNGDCFAKKYYEYKDHDKLAYTPKFKGSCARLKNGASLCITPQVGLSPVSGIIDLNGPKGPNILNKDLRTFSYEAMTRTGRNNQVAGVLVSEFAPLETGEGYDVDPCKGMTCGCGTLPPCEPECSSNPNEWDITCCQKNSSRITSNTHHCCTYAQYLTTNACRSEHSSVTINCQRYNQNTMCIDPNTHAPLSQSYFTFQCFYRTINAPVSISIEYPKMLLSGGSCSTTTDSVVMREGNVMRLEVGIASFYPKFKIFKNGSLIKTFESLDSFEKTITLE